MAKAWRMVRVPVGLATKLTDLAEDLLQAHILGRTRLPNEYCERVPIHAVIARAVAEMESHRKRSGRRGGDEAQ
jgi:DNA-directed RNA polymerase sigma subunit (sigma70/sigma32)